MQSTGRLDDKPMTASSSGRDLAGRVAWVTGGSRGIGRAIALTLAGRGAAVAVGARNLQALESLSAEIGRLGADCLIQSLDVRDSQSVHAFAQATTDRLGSPDILVNNAGIYKTEPVRGHSLEIWKEVIDVNLTGALLTSRSVLDSMIAKGWGRIINISSISGKTGEAFGAAYCASKFGLIGLSQSLALEVARYGITVNAVCPGWVSTDMAVEQLTDQRWCQLNSLEPAESQEIARLSVPQERFISPDEVAQLVTYLCTDFARGITGQAMNICGGMVLH